VTVSVTRASVDPTATIWELSPRASSADVKELMEVLEVAPDVEEVEEEGSLDILSRG